MSSPWGSCTVSTWTRTRTCWALIWLPTAAPAAPPSRVMAVLPRPLPIWLPAAAPAKPPRTAFALFDSVSMRSVSRTDWTTPKYRVAGGAVAQPCNSRASMKELSEAWRGRRVMAKAGVWAASGHGRDGQDAAAAGIDCSQSQNPCRLDLIDRVAKQAQMQLAVAVHAQGAVFLQQKQELDAVVLNVVAHGLGLVVAVHHQVLEGQAAAVPVRRLYTQGGISLGIVGIGAKAVQVAGAALDLGVQTQGHGEAVAIEIVGAQLHLHVGAPPLCLAHQLGAFGQVGLQLLQRGMGHKLIV